MSSEWGTGEWLRALPEDGVDVAVREGTGGGGGGGGGALGGGGGGRGGRRGGVRGRRRLGAPSGPAGLGGRGVGDSGIVDFSGQKICQISGREGQFTTELSLEDLHQFRRQLPFLEDADTFQLF